MAINVNIIDMIGWVTIILGVSICIVGIVFFLAVCRGIGPGGDLHDTYFIIINGTRRLIFLLPVASGVLLLISGVMIRGQLPYFKNLLTGIPFYNKEAEQDASSNH